MAQETPPLSTERAISHIRGDLYQVQDGRRFTVFLLTPEGIILADPLGVATARWLRGELTQRFPSQPVRYLVHSHHAFDRAAGGGVFDATAERIGHQDFDTEVEKGRSKERASFADVVGIESTYRSSRTVTLGGKSVQLIHPGRAYSADMTVLYFPAERVVFAADYPPLASRPFSFRQSTSTDVLASLRIAEAPDFDTFISGDGDVGTKADVTALRQYVEDLVAGVQAGFKAGRTLGQLQASLTLDKHQGTPNYAQRSTNITEAYGTLRRFTIGAYGAAQLNYLQGGELLGSTTSPIVTMGAILSPGPISAIAEVTTGRQFTDRRFAELSSYAADHRETIISFFPRYDFVRTTSVTVGAGAGLSAVMTKSHFKRVEGFDGLETASSEGTQLGFTIAADVVASLGKRLSLVLPVRLTRAVRDEDFNSLGLWNVQAGVGLLVPVFRRVY